jgi:hypothetical protein
VRQHHESLVLVDEAGDLVNEVTHLWGGC